ncbi:hypothetical protein M758_11G135700 [Ceratodon purpureus]|nr:hypothetical protein M758_11G135700 [Ceratodon purpureus]
MWSFLHKAIAVNQWRNVAQAATSDRCPSCTMDVPESLHHAFFECSAAQEAWVYASTIFFQHSGVSRPSMPWEPLTWDQCLMGTDLPARLRPRQTTWSLLRGSVLWLVWLRRNSGVFQNQLWPVEQLERTIREATIDLAKMSWDKYVALLQHHPQRAQVSRRTFVATWGTTPLLCNIRDNTIQWNHIRPQRGVFR